jgi:glycosyltransferase involved in cell wall biosynthesis
VGTNVCFLSSVHTTTDTRMFYKQCRSLAGAGFKVALIAPHSSDDCQVDFVDGVKVRSFPRARSRLIRMTFLQIRLYLEALREDAEVYHLHDPELMPIGLLLRHRGKKVVYDVREDVPRDILDKQWIPVPLRRPLSRLAESFGRFATSRLSGVVGVTEEMLAPFGQMGVPTAIVRNYPLLEEFLPSVDFGRDRYASGTVACFGGICYLTGARQLIAALDLIPPKMQIRLLLGGLTESEELLSEVQQMPGWSRVNFLGMTPRKHMIQILTGAAVAVVLYNSGRRNLTSLANATKIFESMAAGLPVVVPDLPEWRDFIETYECGIAVSPERPRQIAQAIQRLVTCPEEAAEMGRRGRDVVREKFSWESERGKLVRFYSHLLGNLEALPAT